MAARWYSLTGQAYDVSPPPPSHALPALHERRRCCRFPGYEVDSSQARSESIGALCGLLLLAQALLDRTSQAAADARRAAVATCATANADVKDEGTSALTAADGVSSSMVRRLSAVVSGTDGERLGWVSDTLLQLTPACTVLMVSPEGQVLARYVHTLHLGTVFADPK
jgi:hypothetical protein